MNLRNVLCGIALVVLSASQAIYSKAAIIPQSASSTIQNPQGPGPQAGAQSREDLNLTAEQKAQLKSIRQSEQDQLKALHNDQTLTQDQRAAKAQSIRQASRQQVLGILTPAQQQTIKSNRHGRGDRGQRGRGPEGRRGADGPRGNHQLNLTADQQTQFKSIHESARTQIDAIRNDSTLAPEQKEAKLKSIHQNTKQQVSGILTPAQREEMRHHGRRGGPGGAGGRRGPGRPGGPDGGRRAPLETPGAKP